MSTAIFSARGDAEVDTTLEQLDRVDAVPGQHVAEGAGQHGHDHQRQDERVVAGELEGTKLAKPVIDELVTVVLTASRVLVGVSARSLAEVEDTVTITQFRTLVVLDNHGEVNLHGLAGLLEVTASTVMRMINRLLIAGMVTRRDNPENRREVLLGLTRDGQKLVQKVTTKRRAEITRIVAAMPDARRDELVTALRAFADAAHEPEPRPEATAGIGW